MRIHTLTVTGADDSVDPRELLRISEDNPFVEWGILLGLGDEGRPRFGSARWLQGLLDVRSSGPMRLCAHLCGHPAREILTGESTIFVDRADFYSAFERIQLNQKARKLADPEPLIRTLRPFAGEVIFISGGKNHALLESACAAGLRCSKLFDGSGGRGKTPSQWPTPFPEIPCGYAGGLGPDNLASQLERIAKRAGDVEVWIDMESGVRSDDDLKFDLDKARDTIAILRAAQDSGTVTLCP